MEILRPCGCEEANRPRDEMSREPYLAVMTLSIRLELLLIIGS